MINKVYLIILNYNGWKDTIECLESVLKSNYSNYQIVVVDNNSPNNSMDYIINWSEGKQEIVYDENSQLKHLSQPLVSKPLEYICYTKQEALQGGDSQKETAYKNPLIFIQAGENGGFSAGNNIGIKYALARGDFEYIWLLNNDTVIESTTLSSLVDKSDYYKKTDNKVGLLGSKLRYYDNPLIIQAIGGKYNKWIGTSEHIGVSEMDYGQYNNEKIVDFIDYPVGASLFISKDFINDVGLMSEEYFLYYEELDWVLRGRKKEWKIGFCWESIVYHKEGSSIGTQRIQRSALAEFYLFRNRLIFSKKFFKPYYCLVYVRLFLTYLKRLLFRSGTEKIVNDALRLTKKFDFVQ
jgi:hypothetical protein